MSVLASLALELHSSKANKRVLLEELKRARGAAAPAPRGEATLVQRLTDSRDRLNRHAEMMHAPHEPSGLTPFRLLGDLIRARESRPARPTVRWKLPRPGLRLTSRRRRELVEEIAERVASDGAPHRHPWRGVRPRCPRSAPRWIACCDIARSRRRRPDQDDRRCRARMRVVRPRRCRKPSAKWRRLLAFAEAAAAMPECDRQAVRDAVWGRAEDVARNRGERRALLETAEGIRSGIR